MPFIPDPLRGPGWSTQQTMQPLVFRVFLRYNEVMRIELDREDDGRWIAEIPELLGVMVYGSTRDAAISKAKALALRVLADRLEHGEEIPELKGVFAVPV